MLPLARAERHELPVVCCLLANLNSLTTDFVIRTKLTYIHLSYFVLKQIPVVPPQNYSAEDVRFIVPRVLELVYTANDVAAFAQDIYEDADDELRRYIEEQYQHSSSATVLRKGESLPAFGWNSTRRAQLRAELDAYYAHLYGLTREEICYVLNPKDVLGCEFPSETFRVLKEREEKEFGEYRTGRLVLAAFDKLTESSRFRDDVAKRASAFELPSTKTLVAVQ